MLLFLSYCAHNRTTNCALRAGVFSPISTYGPWKFLGVVYKDRTVRVRRELSA